MILNQGFHKNNRRTLFL